MVLKKVAVHLGVAAACLNGAYAQETGNALSFSGFGSLGLVHSNYRNADFKVDDSVPTGAGRSHDWSGTQMSRLGGQVDAQFSERLSATVQAVAEYNYDNSYAPDITLAFAKYQLTSSVAAGAGRFVLPVYMLSEYSRVGYALPWARPPLEMYRTFPTVDGVELMTQSSLGDAVVRTKVYYGRSSHKGKASPDTNSSEVVLHQASGVNVTADVDASTFRVAYLEAKSETKSSTISSVMDDYRRQGYGALADKYQPKDKIVRYMSLGYAYDPGDWFLRTEFAKVSWKSENLLPAGSFGYVSAGYRYGKFTPYAIYGYAKDDSRTSIGAADPIGAINLALMAGDASRHSLSLGVRWDFRDNMDFKLQLTRTQRDKDTSNNGLSYFTPGTGAPSSYNTVFAGVDFVF